MSWNWENLNKGMEEKVNVGLAKSKLESKK